MPITALPFAYKYLIMRNDAKDWERAHITIFDFRENPLPGRGEGSLLKAMNFCPSSLRKTEKVLGEINAAEEVKGAGCKYCIFSIFLWCDDWNKRGIVLKLVNCNTAPKEVLGQQVGVTQEYIPEGAVTPMFDSDG
ncbi:hypothetical protein ABW19_dt0203571 [Dactylella cylindrospora]|nr:hypothetical protein ABW19_dt0203571 [Dactylella cylindrospora]